MTWALALQAEDYAAQREQVAVLGHLTNAPIMYPAEGFAADGGIKAVFFEALPWKGKPTRVFAWLGLPQKQTGKVPGIVLVHGGGGTAFKEWVQLWNAKDFAAISIAVEGQTDVRNAASKDQDNPSGWQRHDGIQGDGNLARVSFRATKPIEKAVLISTTDLGFAGHRRWANTSAKLELAQEGVTVEAELPPRTTAWFVNLHSGVLIASSDFFETQPQSPSSSSADDRRHPSTDSASVKATLGTTRFTGRRPIRMPSPGHRPGNQNEHSRKGPTARLFATNNT